MRKLAQNSGDYGDHRGYEARGMDLGASNYLIKPVQRDRLAVLVEKHRARSIFRYHGR